MIRRPRVAQFVPILLPFLLTLGPVFGHGGPASSDLDLTVSASTIQMEILFTWDDLQSVVFADADENGRLDATELDAVRTALIDICRRCFSLSADGQTLEPNNAIVDLEVRPPASVDSLGPSTIITTLRYDLSREPKTVRLSLTFPATGTDEHLSRVRIRWAEAEEQAELRGDQYIDITRPDSDRTNRSSGPTQAPDARADLLAGLRTSAVSPVLWALLLVLLSACVDRRSTLLTVLALAGGLLGGGLLASTGPLSPSPTAAGVVAAASVVYIAIENILAPRSGWRVPIAMIAGGAEGVALARGAELAPGGLAATAAITIIGGLVIGWSFVTLRQRSGKHAERLLDVALASLLALLATVVAIARLLGTPGLPF